MRPRKDFLDLQDIKVRARKMPIPKKTFRIFASNGTMNLRTWSMELVVNSLLGERLTMKSIW